MVEFNLLPWRAAKRRFIYRGWLQCVGGLLLLLLLQYLAEHRWLVWLQEQAQQKLAAVTQEKIQYESLQEAASRHLQGQNKQSFASLKHYQLTFSSLFQVENRIDISQICVSSMQREKDRIVISGEVKTIAELIIFLKHWQVKERIASYQIQQIQKNEKNKHFQFRVVAVESANPFVEQHHDVSL